MNKDELRLIKKAIKGNKKAFEELLKQHYEQIYRTAFIQVQTEEDALDVVQEATFQAYRSIHSLKHPEYFMTWFTRILLRCAASAISKKRKLVPISAEALSSLADIPVSGKDESIELLQAIEELKENYRTAILLFYYKDYPIKKISEMMEVPEGTVKTYLSRGKAALKKYYEGEEQNHG